MGVLQMPHLAPAEIAVILATLLAFSKIYKRSDGRNHQRVQSVWNSSSPTIEECDKWIRHPSLLEFGLGVIEAMIGSFRAVLPSYVDGIDLLAIYDILDLVQPPQQSSSTPEPLRRLWTQRLGGGRSHADAIRHLNDKPALHEPRSISDVELDRLSIRGEKPPPDYLAIFAKPEASCGSQQGLGKKEGTSMKVQPSSNQVEATAPVQAIGGGSQCNMEGRTEKSSSNGWLRRAFRVLQRRRRPGEAATLENAYRGAGR